MVLKNKREIKYIFCWKALLSCCSFSIFYTEQIYCSTWDILICMHLLANCIYSFLCRLRRLCGAVDNICAHDSSHVKKLTKLTYFVWQFLCCLFGNQDWNKNRISVLINKWSLLLTGNYYLKFSIEIAIFIYKILFIYPIDLNDLKSKMIPG